MKASVGFPPHPLDTIDFFLLCCTIISLRSHRFFFFLVWNSLPEPRQEIFFFPSVHMSLGLLLDPAPFDRTHLSEVGAGSAPKSQSRHPWQHSVVFYSAPTTATKNLESFFFHLFPVRANRKSPFRASTITFMMLLRLLFLSRSLRFLLDSRVLAAEADEDVIRPPSNSLPSSCELATLSELPFLPFKRSRFLSSLFFPLLPLNVYLYQLSISFRSN